MRVVAIRIELSVCTARWPFPSFFASAFGNKLAESVCVHDGVDPVVMARSAPFLIPFHERVKVFMRVVSVDRVHHREEDTMTSLAFGSNKFFTIRRTHILEVRPPAVLILAVVPCSLCAAMTFFSNHRLVCNSPLNSDMVIGVSYQQMTVVQRLPQLLKSLPQSAFRFDYATCGFPEVNSKFAALSWKFAAVS